MKREDLITPAELQALLGDNGGGLQEFAPDEPIGAQHLYALQQAVVLLSRQVAELQEQLQGHFQEQHLRHEQLLRQFQHHLEYKLYEQMMNGVILQRTPVAQQQETLPGETPAAAPADSVAELHPALIPPPADPHSTEEPEEIPPTYSRVKSYRKIRKRKKSFLERLFE
ncbi:hypothetical protein ABE504_01245 [Paenibacillus oryzisoli]|uniref:hypothetical protein n=1 Tax=Paenibacillus oryzisoli TaxID=1850517 RepID=UPI003D2C2829